MGSSCIHVTRATHWKKSADTPITLDEIERLSYADGELEILDVSYGINPMTGGRIPLRGVHILWHGHRDGPVALSLDAGRLSVIDPDDVTIDKMRAIAALLGATVQDDYS